MHALIGHTGFVGSTLSRQRTFDRLFNSKNFEELANCSFDRVICAGLPAAKWLANSDPEADLANIKALCAALRNMEANEFILISTIDVYPRIFGVDESFDCHSMENNPYGAHRLLFEEFVGDRFASSFILRLPALFGLGLKKNAIYDLLHDNCLDLINPDSSFQWYDMNRLADDIDTAVNRGISLVGLMTEPLATRQILDRYFPGKILGQTVGPEVHYDVRTRYAELFGGRDGYIMDAEAVMQRLGRYIESTTVTADA